MVRNSEGSRGRRIEQFSPILAADRKKSRLAQGSVDVDLAVDRANPVFRQDDDSAATPLSKRDQVASDPVDLAQRGGYAGMIDVRTMTLHVVVEMRQVDERQ